MSEGLIPLRSCGTCNVCCVALTINEPTLRKPLGFRCRNAQADNSCAIYASRPQTCRTFYCGWRQVQWIPEPLRPDQSGLLLRGYEPTANNSGRKPGLAIMPLPNAVIDVDGLFETIARAVSVHVLIYLELPGEPGYTSVMVPIDEQLARAALAQGKPAILGLLRDALSQAAKVPRARVVLPSEVAPSAEGIDPSGTGGEKPQSAVTRAPIERQAE